MWASHARGDILRLNASHLLSMPALPSAGQRHASLRHSFSSVAAIFGAPEASPFRAVVHLVRWCQGSLCRPGKWAFLTRRHTPAHSCTQPWALWLEAHAAQFQQTSGGALTRSLTSLPSFITPDGDLQNRRKVVCLSATARGTLVPTRSLRSTQPPFRKAPQHLAASTFPALLHQVSSLASASTVARRRAFHFSCTHSVRRLPLPLTCRWKRSCCPASHAHPSCTTLHCFSEVCTESRPRNKHVCSGPTSSSSLTSRRRGPACRRSDSRTTRNQFLLL